MASSGLFTFCPSCLKQFRIQATELSFASGVVCCGLCGEQFNALLRLSDAPLSATEQESWSQSVVDAPQSYDLQADPAVADVAKADPVAAEVVALQTPLLVQRAEIEVELLEQLQSVQSSPRNRFAKVAWGKVAWGGGGALLCLLLLVQLLWFNRDAVLDRYPQFFSFAKVICQRFDCDVLRYKHVAAIHLVQRNVAYHPTYPDRLNISAKILNKSDHAQAFPRVQLALFDTLGKVIAHGEFEPEAYVREGVDIESGMSPKGTTDFVLSLYGAPAGATSFEFLFL